MQDREALEGDDPSRADLPAATGGEALEPQPRLDRAQRVDLAGNADDGDAAMAGGGGSGEPKSSEWLGDRSFHDAVQSMYRYNRTGADFFRRKLNIGYNKATSYVEQLEDLGFLGPQKGTAAREIIRSWDDWIDLLKSSGALPQPGGARERQSRPVVMGLWSVNRPLDLLTVDRFL